MNVKKFERKPDEKTCVSLFRELVAIDSESLNERAMADTLKQKLADLGFAVDEDAAGEKLGGNAGNLYGILKGDPAMTPLLFSAHMDTVKPGNGKTAVVRADGTITGNGKSVLGADDVSGLVEILEGVRLAKDSGLPHGDVEILFPPAEELYAKGSACFDFSRVRAKTAYVLDMSEPVGKAAYKAPSIISFEARVNGRAAHAGFAPEKGANAIQAAAHAVARLTFGRVGDGETTFNIGTVRGGTAPNIVPDAAVLVGEVRGYDHETAIRQVERAEKIFQEETRKTGCGLTFKKTVDVYAYETGLTEPVCRRFAAACEAADLPEPAGGRFRKTFGGSDNNTFARNGIRGIVLGNGMRDVHTVRENTTVSQLVRGAKLVAALICQGE